MDEAEQLIHDTKAIVLALSLAEIGGVNAMANEETIALTERLDGDPQLTYGVLRLFAATVAAFAKYSASEASPNRTGAALDDLTAEFIRRGIDGIELTAYPRPGD